jgi:hypothetical protein
MQEDLALNDSGFNNISQDTAGGDEARRRNSAAAA